LGVSPAFRITTPFLTPARLKREPVEARRGQGRIPYPLQGLPPEYIAVVGATNRFDKVLSDLAAAIRSEF